MIGKRVPNYIARSCDGEFPVAADQSRSANHGEITEIDIK